jgi:hypothetical protein
MDVPLTRPEDALHIRLVEEAVRSALPRLEQFGIATAAEVGIETYAERYATALATTGAVHTRVPMVRAWTCAAVGSSCRVRACYRRRARRPFERDAAGGR